MGIKFTEKELESLLNKNDKIKISQEFGGNKIKKISLNDNIEDLNTKKEKKITSNSNINVSEINYINTNCQIQITCSNEHFSVIFLGAKLLSVNQIFSILQYRKYEIFKYKKVWHNLVFKALNIAKEEGELPFFDDSVDLTLFRQAKRLVDEDAMTTMFKYIIDGFKKSKDNPLGILKEDNPKIVHKISCYSELGEPLIGIKIKKIKELKPIIKAKDLLIS